MKTEIVSAVVAAAAWIGVTTLTPAAAEPQWQVAAETGASTEDDEYQGLPPGKGRDETLGICAACHSIKLVAQQGLSRSSWEEVFEYMVDEHEMPELEPEDHKLILDYLTKFYGTERRARN